MKKEQVSNWTHNMVKIESNFEKVSYEGIKQIKEFLVKKLENENLIFYEMFLKTIELTLLKIENEKEFTEAKNYYYDLYFIFGQNLENFFRKKDVKALVMKRLFKEIDKIKTLYDEYLNKELNCM